MKTDFRIAPSACILIAVFLLTVPFLWTVSWLLGVFLHEAFHFAAILICGGDVRAVELRPGGARMVTDGLSRKQEIFCALAGPLSAIATLPVRAFLPQLTVCACFLSAYNLLPVMPLDGGRAISNFLRLLLREKTARIVMEIIRYSVIFAVIAGGIYTAVFCRMGIFPVMLASAFCLKYGKAPCKMGGLGIEYTQPLRKADDTYADRQDPAHRPETGKVYRR